MGPTIVTAQDKVYKGKIHITLLELKQRGDSLYISIIYDISGVNVNTNHSVDLIPSLIAPGHNTSLPKVTIKGRANYNTYKREMALMSHKEQMIYNENRPYTVVKGYKRSDDPKKISYSKVIPYESWMSDAHLDMREDLCGCGSPARTLTMSQLIDHVQTEVLIVPYTITPYLVYVQPVTETIKKREIKKNAFLDFAVNKTDIRPDYMNNPTELKKITDLVEEVRNDSAITVRGITVIGYASPEGAQANNQRLSEERAKALIKYLIPRFPFAENLYHIEFGGENWAGLRQAVEQSDVQYKTEILHILKTVPERIDYQTNAIRKRTLMNLRAGEPYRYMLKEFFPSLRKAICKIDYEVKGFDVTKAKTVIKTHPQNLSLNELYLVANTYEPGTPEFIEVFETAVRMFPEDETANLNAASAALSRKDTVTAQQYLNKIKLKTDMPQYDNTRGVLSMLKGDYDTAEHYLKKAVAAGINIAAKNLREIEKKRENIRLIESKNDRQKY